MAAGSRTGSAQERSATAVVEQAGRAPVFASVDERTLALAEEAMQGLLLLPGTGGEPRFVGDPPDWFADPVGDPEYTWTLNRLEHWSALIRAWRLTGDGRYGDRVVLELRDWLVRCPCPPIDPAKVGEQFHDGTSIGRIRTVAKTLRRWPAVYRTTQRVRATVKRVRTRGPVEATVAIPLGQTPYNTKPWRTLEVGTRMVHVWPMLASCLEELAPGDDTLLADFVAAAEKHGEVLAELPRLIWPDANHNHYLMECLGLLRTAISFPQLEQSERWREQAMREIERCAAAQFTEDGGHVEACPHYHNVCVFLLAQAVHVAHAAGYRFGERTVRTLVRSLDHCLQTLRPDGTGVPAGDSDADQLAVQATLFGYLATGDVEPLRAVTALTGLEALRDVMAIRFASIDDPAGILARCERPVAIAAPLVGWQRQLGQVTMRTGWDRDAIGLFFACNTPVFNGHAHADPASFDLTALGQPILIDPGRLTYVDNALRRKIKSAAWHNTVTVDGREPFEYLSSMQYGPQRPGDITGVYRGPRLMAAESCQLNFAPATHRRLVAIVDESLVIVLDRFDGLRRKSRVQVRFHLGSDRVEWADDRRSARGEVADVSVHLYVTPDLVGHDRPGQMSTKLGVATDTVRLRFDDAPGESDRVHAALVVPRRAADATPEVADFAVVRDGETVRCTFTLDGRRSTLEWIAAAGSEGVARIV